MDGPGTAETVSLRRELLAQSHLVLALLVALVILIALHPERILQGDLQISLSGAVQFNAFRTLSGLMTLAGMLALLSKHFTTAAVLFIIDGAAGTGVFWERWTYGTEHHMELSALASGVRPTADEWELLVTHLPLLILGVAMIATMGWRGRARGTE